ncbi:hypothetical protein GSI_15643 [Ganoderma sinense ZZ0214-1]|uniref:Aminoglycoside phosphotransferase domain-containing protein n=1 Tax=Ganoderma sinense ZZ0214-1 TaxID=1077348 RepID=A0A2G8RN63_9APHY|nr:hypothetical protein GSI_15643 [Ganoderma sinense ZZ0214-1]
MYVKQSFLGGLEEGEAIRFVAAHTESIPVPVVVDNLVYGKRSYLVMSRLPGEQLSWLYPELPLDAEPHLSAQLSRMLTPLRAIPAPASSAVCSFGGGPVNCWRMTLSPPLGPWESVAAFHEELMLRAGPLTYIPEDVDSEMVHDVIREVHSREYRLCLTHNDLGPHNILVDDRWNITGIVDWESCAWMPEYWEATKGCYLPQYRKGRWKRIMLAAFPQYATELEAENYIVNWRQCYA